MDKYNKISTKFNVQYLSVMSEKSISVSGLSLDGRLVSLRVFELNKLAKTDTFDKMKLI